MLSQNQIKQITALKVKKFREERGLFIAEGGKLVTELIGSRYRVTELYADAGWIIANLPLIQANGIPAFETLPREMERISGLTTPGPVLAVVEIPNAQMHECTNAQMHEGTTRPQHISTSAHQHIGTSAPHHVTTGLSLTLDDIRDPGNLGTIIRIADWFGIGQVICSLSSVDLYNPKVVQATMGSITRVEVIYTDLADMLRQLPAGFPVYGAFLDGESIYSEPLDQEGLVVIGNESRGISREVEPLITKRISIPSFGTSEKGKAESLNASVAAGVICAEFRRTGGLADKRTGGQADGRTGGYK